MELRRKRKNSKSEVLEDTIKKKSHNLNVTFWQNQNKINPDCRFEGGCCWYPWHFCSQSHSDSKCALELWLRKWGLPGEVFSLSKCIQNPGIALQEAYIGSMLVYWWMPRSPWDTSQPVLSASAQWPSDKHHESWQSHSTTLLKTHFGDFSYKHFLPFFFLL